MASCVVYTTARIVYIQYVMTNMTQTMTTYEIQTRSDRHTEWDADAVGDRSANRFATREEAEEAIEGLRALGDDWADAEYRVVPVR